MTVIARPIQAFDLGIGDAILMPLEHGGECLMVASAIFRTGVDELCVEFEETDIPGAPISMNFVLADELRIEERFCRASNCADFALGDTRVCEKHLI
jgi:hypothetical protein